MKMKLSDIIINEEFAQSIPAQIKMEVCRIYWNKHKRQDRYIVVNSNNVLIDGYIQYLILKENGVEEAEIKVSDIPYKKWRRKGCKRQEGYKKQPITYVYGKHFNEERGEFSKEYVWRVPNCWRYGDASDINEGDELLVKTRYGTKSIVVTRIETSDECPVQNGVVRKVYKKVVRNNNEL